MELPSRKDFEPYLGEIQGCFCFVCDEKGLAFSKFAHWKRANPPPYLIEPHHKALIEVYTQLVEGRHKRMERKEREEIDRFIRHHVREHNRIELSTPPVTPIGPHEAAWHKRNGRNRELF